MTNPAANNACRWVVPCKAKGNMKLKSIITVLLVAIILASCTPSAKVIPTEIAITASTFTPIPPTPSFTPTSKPTIDAEGQSVPNPRFSNPELFDLKNSDSPIPQFANSMKMAEIDVDPQQVTDGIAFESKTSAEGKPFVIGYYNLDPDPTKSGEVLEGKTPFLIATRDGNGIWKWQKITPRILAMYSGRIIGTQIVNYKLNDSDYSNQVHEFGNLAMVAGELDPWVIIGDHSETQWQQLGSKEIEKIIVQLKSGQDPNKLFSFGSADKVVLDANQNGLYVEGLHIFVNWYLPEDFKKELVNKTISWSDYELFLTAYTKAVVSRYNGETDPNLKINQWTIANEIAGASLWSSSVDKQILRKMITEGTFTKIFQTAHEANPNAKLLLNEDHLLEASATDLRTTFLSLVDTLQKQGAPIGGIGIQNHLWLGGPLLSDSDMEAFFQQLDKRHLSVNYTEISISMSMNNQFTGESVQKPFENSYLQQVKYLSSILKPLKSRNGTIAFFGIFTSPGLFDQDNYNDPTANATLFDNYQNPSPKPMYFVLLQFLMGQ
jgi:GH35 family endo-1,4-beta-xylanase